jgi:hypothetical protein
MNGAPEQASYECVLLRRTYAIRKRRICAESAIPIRDGVCCFPKHENREHLMTVQKTCVPRN